MRSPFTHPRPSRQVELEVGKEAVLERASSHNKGIKGSFTSHMLVWPGGPCSTSNQWGKGWKPY